jgi:hypothetical protein
MKRRLLIVFALIFGAAGATAVWPENLEVRGSVNVQWTRACAPTADGGLICVWSDAHGEDRDIFAQRVGPQGNAVWTAPLTVDGKSGVQQQPVMAGTSDGNYIVAWRDYHDNLEGEIYLQKLSPTGQLLWQPGGIRVTNDGDSDYDPLLAADGLGGVIVAWTSYSSPQMRQFAQSYAADGTRRWAEGGIDLTGLDYYLATTLVPDGNDGFVIAYSSDFVADSCVYLKRFNPDGSPAWPNPVCIGDGQGMFRLGLVTLGGNDIYLLWSDYSGNDDPHHLQKYSLQGIPQWPQPLEIIVGNQGNDTPLQLAWSPADDTVILSIVDNGDPGSLFLRKVSSAGQLLWNGSEAVDDSLSYYLYDFSSNLASDGQGGCYIVWACYDNGTWIHKVNAKRYDQNGINVWQPEGVVLSQAPGYKSLPMMQAAGNGIWAAWYDQKGEDNGIYYQLLTPGGVQQLEPGGRMLFGGLNSMYTEGRMTLARSSDLILIWDDDRLDGNTSQLYLQVINPDGSFDFALNGIPVTQGIDSNQYIRGALVLPDDQTVVAWMDGRDGYYDLYAQLLGVNGEHLWGETGMLLAELGEAWVDGVEISSEGGDVYFGWTNHIFNGQHYVGSVWAQKVAGGQIQWGVTGVPILNDIYQFHAGLCDLQGRFYVFDTYDLGGVYNTDVRVMLLNAADGTPAAGWGQYGLPVALGGDSSDCNRDCIATQLLPQGVFVLYSENSVLNGGRVMAQLLGPGGDMLYGSGGSLLFQPLTNFYSAVPECGAEDFFLLWGSSDNNASQTNLRRFDYALAPVWETLVLDMGNGYYYDNSLIRFTNDACCVMWKDYVQTPGEPDSDGIRYLYVTPEGELAGTQAGEIYTGARYIYNLQNAGFGNRALVTWSDGSSYWKGKDEPIEHRRLWAQMINNETVDNDDPANAPGPAAILGPNYPNPFNPSTTIQYQLNSAAEVRLAVYNLKGQLVKTLVNGYESSGSHLVVWDGLDDRGLAAASGVYFYRLNAGGCLRTGKMLLLK